MKLRPNAYEYAIQLITNPTASDIKEHGCDFSYLRKNAELEESEEANAALIMGITNLKNSYPKLFTLDADNVAVRSLVPNLIKAILTTMTAYSFEQALIDEMIIERLQQDDS